jgi:spore maturation protein CgeB
VVTYKTPMEAVEKVLYLLKNPTVAKAIAEAGQKRTLENYTYEKRLLEAIPSLLN